MPDRAVRKPGYYWVLYVVGIPWPTQRLWSVAQWTGSYWLEAGTQDSFGDEDYAEIGHRLKPPG